MGKKTTAGNDNAGNDQSALHVCPKCKKVCKENDPAVECGICNYWYHIKCGNMSEKLYDALQEDKTNIVLFTCPTCKEIAVPLLRSMTELEKRQKKTEEDVEALQRDKLDRSEISQIFQSELEKPETKEKILAHVSESQEQQKETSAEEMRSTVLNCVLDIQEVEKRKDNIILHGHPEQASQPGAAAQPDVQSENKEVLDILNKLTPLEPGDIITCKRLGEKKADQSRPILIKLKSASKVKIMKNLKKLKDISTDLSIRNDLPKRVRERRNQLMETERNSKGAHKDDFLYKFQGPIGNETVVATRKPITTQRK